MAIDKIQTGLRLEETLYQKLKTLSKQENRSINNFVEYIVQKYVDDYEKDNGAIAADSFQDS